VWLHRVDQNTALAVLALGVDGAGPACASMWASSVKIDTGCTASRQAGRGLA
jgi:hypothetical protein